MRHLSLIVLLLTPSLISAQESVASNDFSAHIADIVLELGIILMLAKLGGLLFAKLKVPSVLGELVIGIAIGPYLLGSISLPGFPHGLFPLSAGTIPISDQLYALATIASIILLFVSGLETDIALLLRYSVAGILVGVGGVVFSFATGVTIGYFFLGKSLFDPVNLFLGVISTATSVGITARILSEKRKMDSPEGVTILAGAVIDDVLGIILLAIISGIAVTEAKEQLQIRDVELLAIKALTVWLGFTVAGLALASYLNRFLKTFRSTTTISVFSLGMAFILAGIFEKTGLAMIIGAYIMGLTLSKTDLNYPVHEALSSLYSFFVPVFFVVMGMMVNIRELLNPQILIFGCIYTVSAIVAKIIGCGIPSLFLNFNKIGALRIGMGMVPRGEVALIIAGIGLSSGIIDHTIFGAVVMMTLITTIIAPPMLSLLLSPQSGVRRELTKRTTTSTPFDFHTPELTELLTARIVQYFTSEGFYVHTMRLESQSIHEFRKDGIIINATAQTDSIVFETDQQDVLFVKTVVYEALLQLNSTIQKVRDYIQPETLRRELTEVQARTGLDISKLLDTACIIPSLKSDTKSGIIEEMLEYLDRKGLLKNRKAVLDAVMERENTMSTGMQNGVAIPHGRSDAVYRMSMAIGISRDGVDFQSLDGETCRIFIMVISPSMSAGPHIQFLAGLCGLLNNEDFRVRLLKSRNKEEIYSCFKSGMS